MMQQLRKKEIKMKDIRMLRRQLQDLRRSKRKVALEIKERQLNRNIQSVRACKRKIRAGKMQNELIIAKGIKRNVAFQKYIQGNSRTRHKGAIASCRSEKGINTKIPREAQDSKCMMKTPCSAGTYHMLSNYFMLEKRGDQLVNRCSFLSLV